MPSLLVDVRGWGTSIHAVFSFGSIPSALDEDFEEDDDLFASDRKGFSLVEGLDRLFGFLLQPVTVTMVVMMRAITAH
jgi:hypothetical protein